MTNKNIEYERLVVRIYQAILNHEGYKNLRVEHDVKLTGKSGAKHQIDVFWEFKIADNIYRTCIECKNYSSAVKKSHIASFAAVLDDIGNTNGVIATTSSYQSGAKLLAKQRNIRLVLVNQLVKKIHINLLPIKKEYSNFDISFNSNSVKEALTRNGLKSYNSPYIYSGNEPLYNDKGVPAETFNTLLRKQPISEGRNTLDNINLYLNIPKLGKILIRSIAFDAVSVESSPLKDTIINPYDAAIEDIVSNNIHYLHESGEIKKEPLHIEPDSPNKYDTNSF
ncbi:restriction endonuclease [Microbulbifer sp. PAAF003]|uniref:restriction endonuclease n=1 Tax=Microbulbifer sp. PAAF003 TaxID=3243375 RepID=UPI004039C773